MTSIDQAWIIARWPTWPHLALLVIRPRLGEDDAVSVEPEVETSFNDWYAQEHIPALSAVPGAVRARRFRSRAGSPRYLAIYHLVSPAVQASPEWKRAANTPWTERMRPHFRDHVRIVAEATR